MDKITICTLVRNRKTHLVNLIHGLNAQTRTPDELIICYMQDTPYDDLPETSFPVMNVFVKGKDLHLSKARNKAAEAAHYNNLIFLDVDCIPHPECIASYSSYLKQEKAVYLGEVQYLPQKPIKQPLSFENLDSLAQKHAARPSFDFERIMPVDSYTQLWGLSFAIHKETYFKVGGMDEDYLGYGGEETDFALKLEHYSIPMYWCAQAKAYHQWHKTNAAPVEHLTSIIHNATLFKNKWGRWCMEKWLKEFNDMGYIMWNEQSDSIKKKA
jgi:GT2 family glycosyltransferase